MRRCGCDDADRLDRPEKVPIIGQCPGTDLRRNGLTGLLSGIDDAHELALGRLRVLLGMEAPQVTDADDCCCDLPHSPSL